MYARNHAAFDSVFNFFFRFLSTVDYSLPIKTSSLWLNSLFLSHFNKNGQRERERRRPRETQTSEVTADDATTNVAANWTNWMHTHVCASYRQSHKIKFADRLWKCWVFGNCGVATHTICRRAPLSRPVAVCLQALAMPFTIFTYTNTWLSNRVINYYENERLHRYRRKIK